MNDEWGPWIEHDGKGCPCVGQYAHWVFDGVSPGDLNPKVTLINGGKEAIGFPVGGHSWFWDKHTTKLRIIRYRIRKPRALLDLIERARELDDAPEGPVRTPAAPKVTT